MKGTSAFPASQACKAGSHKSCPRDLGYITVIKRIPADSTGTNRVQLYCRCECHQEVTK